jgi:hypothetical protein
MIMKKSCFFFLLLVSATAVFTSKVSGVVDKQPTHSISATGFQGSVKEQHNEDGRFY